MRYSSLQAHEAHISFMMGGLIGDIVVEFVKEYMLD
jgi:hypothetical protein